MADPVVIDEDALNEPDVVMEGDDADIPTNGDAGVPEELPGPGVIDTVVRTSFLEQAYPTQPLHTLDSTPGADPISQISQIPHRRDSSRSLHLPHNPKRPPRPPLPLPLLRATDSRRQ